MQAIVMLSPEQVKKYYVTSKKDLQGFFIIFVASLFYGYEFFIRVAPSVLTHDLMSSLNIDASMLGLLSASFFYGYIDFIT